MPTEPLAYWNGAFVPQSQVRLGINDAGFIWGATATDLCRTFRHQLFRLDAHLLRFRQSCQLARIPQPLDDQQLAFIAQELVRHNAPLIDAAMDLGLVMFATPGEIGYYLGKPGGAGDAPPTLCMHTFPLPFERYARLIREGGRLVTSASWQGAAGVNVSIKHRSRLHWWLAEQKLQETDKGASTLFRDKGAWITETATSNVLAVLRGKVFSPKRSQILPGVSLEVVEELCKDLGLSFHEGNLSLENLLSAAEVMTLSTPYCIAPVSNIDGQSIPWPGPVFHQLIAAWNRKVGLGIWQQILTCSASRGA